MTHDFRGGRAVVVADDNGNADLKIVLRVGPYWKPVGFCDMTLDDRVQLTACTPRRSTKARQPPMALAGVIRDSRVARMEAGGQVQEVEGNSYYIFVWPDGTGEVYLPGRALDAEGQVRYELRPDSPSHWGPEWVVAEPADETG